MTYFQSRTVSKQSPDLATDVELEKVALLDRCYKGWTRLTTNERYFLSHWRTNASQAATGGRSQMTMETWHDGMHALLWTVAQSVSRLQPVNFESTSLAVTWYPQCQDPSVWVGKQTLILRRRKSHSEPKLLKPLVLSQVYFFLFCHLVSQRKQRASFFFETKDNKFCWHLRYHRMTHGAAIASILATITGEVWQFGYIYIYTHYLSISICTTVYDYEICKSIHHIHLFLLSFEPGVLFLIFWSLKFHVFLLHDISGVQYEKFRCSGSYGLHEGLPWLTMY